jgi:hypothetical protein
LTTPPALLKSVAMSSSIPRTTKTNGIKTPKATAVR